MAQRAIHQLAPSSGATPFFFGPPERQLFGFLHAPAVAARHGMGVVLCNPLGYEAMCTHCTYRVLAERLAARGIPTLRFDYDGTGDSAGELDDPGRVPAWLDSIHAAVEELRSQAGVRHVTLFGVRFAATLAALAAGRRRDVDGLILWAPNPTGRAYVREMRAFRMIQDPKVVHVPRADGGEEIAGYLFGASTLAELSSLDLFARDQRCARRALVVPRDDLQGAEPKLAKHLASLGVDVQLAEQPGYARMMRDPQETVVPTATLDAMIDWLEATRGAESQRSVGPVANARSAPPAVTSSPARGVRETAQQFGEDQRLFGIVTEPADDRVAPGRPAVLFLNVGANHHVGPNRMYVLLARELASRGYVSLRFDVAGLGDSPIAPGAPANRLYSKDSVGDVGTAMSFLGAMRGVDRFVLVGLCSGAYLAFHTAVEDTRVAGQILLNPQTFEWKEGDSLELSTRKSFLSTRYYARSLSDYRVWLRLARGEVNVRGIAGTLHDRFRVRLSAAVHSAAARLRGEAIPQTEVERAFHLLGDRGTDTLLVYSFNDGGLDMIEKHLGGGARKMRGRKNFRLEIVDGADHTFTPIPAQETLNALLVRHVTSRFP